MEPVSGIVCGACGHRNPPGANFCSSCGATLRDAADRHTDTMHIEAITEVVDEYDDGVVLPVPGAPRVVHVPGHTAGSSALLLEARGVIFTGDALVTHDCYSGQRGPRLLARVSNDDSTQALASLDTLENLKARIVLPGHGEAFDGSIADAVAAARTAGAA